MFLSLIYTLHSLMESTKKNRENVGRWRGESQKYHVNVKHQMNEKSMLMTFCRWLNGNKRKEILLLWEWISRLTVHLKPRVKKGVTVDILRWGKQATNDRDDLGKGHTHILLSIFLKNDDHSLSSRNFPSFFQLILHRLDVCNGFGSFFFDIFNLKLIKSLVLIFW